VVLQLLNGLVLAAALGPEINPQRIQKEAAGVGPVLQ